MLAIRKLNKASFAHILPYVCHLESLKARLEVLEQDVELSFHATAWQRSHKHGGEGTRHTTRFVQLRSNIRVVVVIINAVVGATGYEGAAEEIAVEQQAQQPERVQVLGDTAVIDH